jgi:glycosyltransferase involved in cell wall biosynthesis
MNGEGYEFCSGRGIRDSSVGIMLKGRDFLVFSDDWGRHPFSCQHIMKHFLPHNRLLWVNTIGMRNPRLTAYDIKRCLEKIHGWFSAKTQEDDALPVDNLTVISPVMTPYNTIGPVRSRNRRSVIDAVRREMNTLGFNEPLLLTTLPNAADYAGSFDESAIIYYCVDEFTKWPGVNQKLVTDMEESLLAKADFVCASADELCTRKTRNGKRPMLLSHGVDYDHFAYGVRAPVENPHNIPHPIVGFFGAISSWLDFTLLASLAREKPEWSFVFVGPVDSDVSAISGFANVYFIGKVPYEKLPGYAALFDVALVPFVIDEMTINVNPLKLMEYLACGLPVVSTPLPEVAKYNGLVSVAATAEEFLKAIEHALASNSQQNREKRMNVAQTHSWSSVANTLSGAIESLLSQKQVRP